MNFEPLLRGSAAIVYRLLLRIFPHGFRSEFERDIQDAFDATVQSRYGSRGAWGAFMFVQREFREVLRLALRERRASVPNDRPAVRRRDMLRMLHQDVRLTIRGLCRARGFTAVALVTLASGLTLNIVLFSLINAVRRPALPFDAPDRILAIGEAYPRYQWTQNPTSLATLSDLRKDTTAFSDVAAYSQRRVSFADGQVPVRLGAAIVTSNLWHTLGVTPHLGRAFSEKEDAPGTAPSVMLGYALWQSRFFGRTDVLGAVVTVDGVRRTVIGVMPDGFQYPETEDLWLPLASVLAINPRAADDRAARGWRIVGRLTGDVTVRQARAQLTAVGAHTAERFPESNGGWTLDAVPVSDESMVATGAFFGALQAGGLLLVGIMCTNLGNLLLARGERRRREIAIRASMGASRPRLMWLLLLEPALLAIAGAAIALVLASWALQLVPLAILERIPFYIRFRIDWQVVVFAMGIAGATAVLSGLASALRTTSRDPSSILNRGSHTVVSLPHAGRLRSTFLFVQTAVAGALLTSTLVVGLALARVQQMDLGFDPTHALLLDIPLPASASDRESTARLAAGRLLEALEGLPGMRHAALSTTLSLARVPGRASAVDIASAGTAPETGPDSYSSVTPDYFAAAGIPVLDGRTFSPNDGTGAENVVILNEEAALRFFGTRHAIGKRLRFGHRTQDRRERIVVGLVRNTTTQPLDPEIDPRMYVPFAQDPGTQLTLTVRTQDAPERLAGAVSEMVRAVDPSLAIEPPVTAQQRLASALWPVRFFNGFAAVSSVFGLMIAGMGVYGLTRYLALARTREIGLRLALGAASGTIAAMVLRQNAAPILGGIIAGLAGSLALSKVLQGLLLGVQPYDPAAFAIATVVLVAAAVAAVGIPAMHAARISPVDALRTE